MNTGNEQHYDIVIVGGGMVGSTMACLLRESPFQIALVDRMDITNRQAKFGADSEKLDPRVSALTAASKKLFTELGVWGDVEKQRCCNYYDMNVWDADGTGSISFAAAELNQPELGTIVENSILNEALYRHISEQENLSFLAPVRIESHRDADKFSRLITESGNSISAKLVIAADGANSKIRELCGFRTREWDYNHHAIVTTVRTELPHQQTALQRFIETGPLAFLPLAKSAVDHEQNYCSIVWSAIPERAEELLALDDEEFCAELTQCIESRLGTIQWCDERFSFPLRQRHAVDYVKGNVVLIGDAAHSIHPLAGQGVNLGFLDAAVLARELVHGQQVGRSVADPTVLGRYQRKRIGHNLGMMWLMEGFKHLFAEQALPIRWLRNIGMSGVDNVSAVKNQLARRAMGLDW
ncbi:MAG: UbiH/UbiF/VisC/COQ6 family ubiquinone biosynthesis hydroxylase [Gammaproteobacteria bacterium]|nr:UbiH/UbiF/VisC/COQ6 family ubiquinone biosynthesis hydroxylase [Gammaproteobacteria bacterium]MDD9894898.1 UbiH/UbiF/VisC/COQ6 family ubiquinone biosynthesis hydroxylase [Gammaproteobacteria bacterium]MDD9958847.1 UbiH/UbiF/VisC/COQ6 family ubiquinone biosynthesis hydroxylase [Gammaproteobacteria bacterium]